MVVTANKRAGFTLIEIVVAILLVGIFSVMVGPKLMDWIGKGKDKKAHIDIKAFKQALDMYAAEKGTYPKDLMDLTKQPHPYVDPESVTVVDGKIVDPWNQPYVYKNTKEGGRQYVLYSIGDPDVEPQTKIDAWEK